MWLKLPKTFLMRLVMLTKYDVLILYELCQHLCVQSCLTHCNPMDCGPEDSSVHGIFQASILEWVAISFSKGPSQSRDWTHVSWIVRKILWTSLLKKNLVIARFMSGFFTTVLSMGLKHFLFNWLSEMESRHSLERVGSLPPAAGGWLKGCDPKRHSHPNL